MARKNRRFSSSEKLRILKRHLVEKEPVSSVCDAEQIAPTQFYQWQKIFFENGTAAFETDDKRQREAQAEELKKLHNQLQRKDAVIAQITEEHIHLKKERGEI